MGIGMTIKTAGIKNKKEGKLSATHRLVYLLGRALSFSVVPLFWLSRDPWVRKKTGNAA
jgi:hypothetical protein